MGRSIHGVKIFGGLDLLEEVINKYDIEGVLITSDFINVSGAAQTAVEICDRHGIWVRQMKLEFTAVERS